MDIIKLVLPAYLASYVINNDSSGITAAEKSKYDDWKTANMPGGAAVDCAEESHFRNFGSIDYLVCPLGGDFLEYTFILRTRHAAH